MNSEIQVCKSEIKLELNLTFLRVVWTFRRNKERKGKGGRYGGIGDKACEESLEGIVQSGKVQKSQQ